MEEDLRMRIRKLCTELGENWDYTLPECPSSTTSLDRIVDSLKGDVSPSDILLLITPAPGPPGEYKLYLLDRSRNGQFVGATNITGDILAELKSSKAFQQYCIVLGTNYIELNTSDQKTAFIRNLACIDGTDAIIQCAEKLGENWDYTLPECPSSTTSLDRIVDSLKGDVWPSDILLLITPAPGPPGEYKLYLLDRSRSGQFVGATNITGDILAELKSSKAFQQYCIVLGTNYIELNTSDQKTAFIRNLACIDGTDAIIQCAEKLGENWDYTLPECPSSTTSLDRIVDSLKGDVWPSDILLLITPAPGPPGEYKLYLLDRSRSGQFVGATNITGDILAELKSSKAFQQYCIVLGTNYIELNTSDQKTAFIRNLLQTIDGCGHRSNANLIKEPSTSKIGQEFTCPCMKELLMSYTTTAPGLERLEKMQSAKQPEDNNLMALMERINNTFPPAEVDLHSFFDLVELYKFKIFIRPELCWKNHADVARFNVECFMVDDNYVGGIGLDGVQLQQKLHEHPRMLQRAKVITDVCEITPLPTPVWKCIRVVFGWLRLELLYGALGEFVFGLFNHYRRA